MQVSLLEAIDIIKSDSDNFIRVLSSYGVEVKGNLALCQFHNDSHPSMGVRDNRYKCFKCGESGDIIDFIRHKENTDLIGAISLIKDILGLDIAIEKDKLDNLKEYIENNFKEWYQDKNYKLDGIYFYRDKDNLPVLARIKYKNKDGKKQFSQANIVDVGEYYKLDFKNEKINLLYNMPLVVKNITENKEIFLVEGEKDADNLKRLGFCATTCREVNSTNKDVLKTLHDAKVVIISDNDDTGDKHTNNIRKLLKNKCRSFRVVGKKLYSNFDKKADISDFIEVKYEEGLNTKQIRKLIIDAVYRSLDEADDNELQQDTVGVYYIFKKYDKEGELIDEKKIYITNFKVLSLARIENIDTDEEIVQIEMISNLGEVKIMKARTNKLFLDPKGFNSFMNMGFSFDGKPKDFNRFKNWVNKYFLTEKRNEYLITGIREIDNKKMLVTTTGGIDKNGNINKDYKATNQITLTDYSTTPRLTKEVAKELKEHLYKFNTNKNVYNILGSLVANMFNSLYRDSHSKNLHVTSYVGESGSGKSFTIDNITRPLLGLDNDTMVFSSLMPHGLLRAINDTYMPILIDEVKPSQAQDNKRQLLSNTIRSITGESTVVKGTQNQSFKTYKYNASLIIAGEEALDETALKNRCNIIWFSCNELDQYNFEHGKYFIKKEGRQALKSLGLEIYLRILQEWDSDRLIKTLEQIESTFKGDDIVQRVQDTFNNTMLGNIVLKQVLIDITGDKKGFESNTEIASLIYQNINENVLEGEQATKQIYDEVLEAIDYLAGGTGQYTIAEDLHFKQDSLFLKFDFKSIYPVLETYYRSRGKTLPINCKDFIKMITKSKYIEGTNKDYYKSVRFGEKTKKVYWIKKDKLINLDMQNLIERIDTFDEAAEL